MRAIYIWLATLTIFVTHSMTFSANARMAGGFSDFCRRALMGMTAVKLQEAAPPTMLLNPVARKYIEMAEANQHLAQMDSRLMSCPNLASDALCVPTVFYNIFRSINLVRGGTNSNLPPEFQMGLLIFANNQLMSAHASRQLVQRYGLNLPPGIVSIDTSKGMDPNVMLDDNNSFLLTSLELHSSPVNLSRQPESALEAAFGESSLVQARIVAGIQGGNQLMGHAIAVLAIDNVSKKLAISDPENPNQILYPSFSTPILDGRAVIMFGLPTASGNPKTNPVYIDGGFALSSSRQTNPSKAVAELHSVAPQ